MRRVSVFKETSIQDSVSAGSSWGAIGHLRQGVSPASRAFCQRACMPLLGGCHQCSKHFQSRIEPALLGPGQPASLATFWPGVKLVSHTGPASGNMTGAYQEEWWSLSARFLASRGAKCVNACRPCSVIIMLHWCTLKCRCRKQKGEELLIDYGRTFWLGREDQELA